jgi:hypothetical protein
MVVQNSNFKMSSWREWVTCGEGIEAEFSFDGLHLVIICIMFNCILAGQDWLLVEAWWCSKFKLRISALANLEGEPRNKKINQLCYA